MLTVHRAEKSGPLADALADLLRTPPPDPFTPEVVAVPAKGIERWLHQHLSATLGTSGAEDGVAANILFPSPARLVDETVALASGVDPGDDAWAPGRLVWTVLEVIDTSLDEPWCRVLQAHLTGHRVTRRYATAEHVTGLWQSYGAERPNLIRDWAAGRDTDGLDRTLPADLRWQAELWRRVRRHVGEPSPAERLDHACARLGTHPGLSPLPARLSLFGPTRLTTVQRQVLDALAVGRDVHLWLPHPSPALWTRLHDRRTPPRRRDDDAALLVTHPLLASLGRDVRELQARLHGADDVHHTSPAPADTLLGWLQSDIAADRPPVPGNSDDGSIQVHACHGPARQVEVLREVLLHLMSTDPTLEPRDVLVMCPDVEQFAPLVRAAFGQGEAGTHPGHQLRVRLADRALRRTNPLLGVLATLLGLADDRVTASQVLDLAATAPVRRMFRFSDDDLERLQTWAADTGVRWGIRTAERRAFGLSDVPQNTWATGLDRLLVGVAADESEPGWLGTALPLDDVSSTDVDLTGRLAELVDRLEGILHRIRDPHGSGPQAAGRWREHLSTALDLFCDVGPGEAWQLGEARAEIAGALEHAGNAELRLADVRGLLAGRLGGRPTRANFRTGELTVATLVPMRSVPHRVVVLLGLDDEVFPRAGGLDGDDVLARDPAPGERDRRSEDRQLLLDAVLSAGERLVILYTGADPVTGRPRPPAVPLGELLDVVRTMVGGDVTLRHPLQPFDSRNFTGTAPFSHDTTALAGARVARQPRVPAPPFLAGPLPVPTGDVDLADLVAFVEHPVRAFLRQRLGVTLSDDETDVVDTLSAELDGLARWQVAERLLQARLRGVPAADWQQAEWRRGSLPPQRLGQELLRGIGSDVEAIVTAAAPLHAAPPQTVDVSLELPGGRLSGSVAGVRDDCLLVVTFSRLKARHRLGAWVRLLALAAAGGPRRAVIVSRGSGGAWCATLTTPSDPLGALASLVQLRSRGLQEPLPVAPEATAEYARRRVGGSTSPEALADAERSFTSRFGEQDDRALGYVFPEPWAALTADPGRFGSMARELWVLLLENEKQGRTP